MYMRGGGLCQTQDVTSNNIYKKKSHRLGASVNSQDSYFYHKPMGTVTWLRRKIPTYQPPDKAPVSQSILEP